MTNASQSVGRLSPNRTHLILPRLPPPWAHVARVVFGVWIAFYVAYFLQLDSPYWAPTTVLLIANPVRGALFSKGLWRILGTIVGAVATVALMAAFPQEPVLFLIGVSLWLGIFTFIASLLRYFRAYAAVLAGFTVSLIAFGAVEHPDTIIDIALARVAAVIVGVLSAAFVSSIVHGSVGEVALQQRIALLISAVAGLLRNELQGRADQSTHRELARIGLDLAGVDELIEFASVESADISRRAAALRVGIAEVFGALVAGSQTMPMVRAAADGPGTMDLIDALKPFEIGSRSPDLGTWRALPRVAPAASDTLGTPVPDGTLIQDGATGTHIMALAHMRELLDRLSRAEQAIGATADDATCAPIRLRPYLDWRTAMRNGLRAMIAMGLGSLFWIATAWPSGGSMLAMLGVICGLLATNPSAAAASVEFAKGVVLSTVCAFICTFGMLTNVDGFPLLALSLLPFVAGGAYASTRPKLAPVAVPLMVFFLPLVGVTNPIHYDIVTFLNTALGYILGSVCAIFAFRVVLPPDQELNVRRLCKSIRRDVQRLGRPGPLPDRLQWEHRQHQKLVQLLGRLRGASEARRETMFLAASAAITVGSAAIDVRAALAAGSIPAPVASAAEDAIGLLRDLRSDPTAAATRATELSRLLADMPASDDLVRVAGAFQRIGTLVQQQRRFFA